jgi:hypothetical protein
VTTSFTTLSADQINADVEAFLDVLGVADHVHVEDASFVETVHHCLWGDTDGRDEEFNTRVDNNGDEFVKFAFGVVVAVVMGSAYELVNVAGLHCVG